VGAERNAFPVTAPQGSQSMAGARRAAALWCAPPRVVAPAVQVELRSAARPRQVRRARRPCDCRGRPPCRPGARARFRPAHVPMQTQCSLCERRCLRPQRMSCASYRCSAMRHLRRCDCAPMQTQRSLCERRCLRPQRMSCASCRCTAMRPLRRCDCAPPVGCRPAHDRDRRARCPQFHP
jgi:hypothetical protein